MRDWEDDESTYDYGPNELAELERTNPDKHNSILRQNIGDDGQIADWHKSNLEWAQACLAEQRLNRK